MKAFLSVLIIFLGSQSFAQDGAIRGRLICEVVDSRLVTSSDTHSGMIAKHAEGFPLGMSLTLEYKLVDPEGLTITLYESNDRRRLIEEPFSAETFRGISPFTSIAEFKAPYSELSFGRFGINYKGNDQIFLKNGCGNGDWIGHYVQTHVSGHFTQVVSLSCRPTIDAASELLARLTVSQ